MEKHGNPRAVRVDGDDVLDLRMFYVSWYTFGGCEEHGEQQGVRLEVVFGALDPERDENIEKTARLALTPLAAFDLGNALVAAANRAEFLRDA